MAEAEEAAQDTIAVERETKEAGVEKQVVVEEGGDMESRIQRAMRSRVPHFKKLADSLTFEGVRRLIEEDLGQEKYALDVHKRFFKQFLLECLNGGDGENGSKSSAETVEKNVDTGNGEVAESLEKEQLKEDVKVPSSEDEEKMEDSPVMGLLTENKKTKVQTKQTQGVGKKEVPTESTIKEAIKKRASYLKANSDTVTMGGFRRLLEEDLELDKDTLFSFKKYIAEQVDKVLKSPKVSEPASVKKKISAKKSDSKASKKIDSEVSSESLDSKSEEIDNQRKSKKKVAPKKTILKSEEPRKRKRPVKETKESSKKRSKHAEASEENSDAEAVRNVSEDDKSQSSAEKPVKTKEVATPAYGKRVERLKLIIKSCGMSVPPVVYKKVKQVSENKREDFLVKELEDILSREGLSADPSEKEIKEVRKRKDRAKELEGIDMSNIVSSTRRRSTTSFVPPPKPKETVKSDSEKAEVSDSRSTTSFVPPPKPKETVKSDSEKAEVSDSSNDEDGTDDDNDDEDGDDSQSDELNEDEEEDSD